jgi:hypothetical protein
VEGVRVAPGEFPRQIAQIFAPLFAGNVKVLGFLAKAEPERCQETGDRRKTDRQN